MIQGRVHRIGNKWALVAFEEVHEAVFQALSMSILDSKGISLVLGPSNEVHGDEVDHV